MSIKNKYTQFVLAMGIFLITYFLLIPLTFKAMVPQEIKDAISNQSIDATSLFYTESTQSFDAYLYFNNGRLKKKQMGDSPD